MKQNYLYKCTDCETVKSVSDNLGESTWVLSCKSCGSCVTEHYQIVLSLEFDKGCPYSVKVRCTKEKEEEEEENGNVSHKASSG